MAALRIYNVGYEPADNDFHSHARETIDPKATGRIILYLPEIEDQDSIIGFGIYVN